MRTYDRDNFFWSPVKPDRGRLQGTKTSNGDLLILVDGKTPCIRPLKYSKKSSFVKTISTEHIVFTFGPTVLMEAVEAGCVKSWIVRPQLDGTLHLSEISPWIPKLQWFGFEGGS